MTTHSHLSLASDWVKRFIHLIPHHEDSCVIDLACGSGRHTLFALEQGYKVIAVDLQTQALDELKKNLATDVQNRLEVMKIDLEQSEFPNLKIDQLVSGLIVTNYLYRPHFQSLLDLLAPGGILIYETFALGNEQFGKHSNPAFLLQKDELWQYMQSRNDFSVVSFEQGYVERPKPAMIQRICAVKQNIIGLQLHYEH